MRRVGVLMNLVATERGRSRTWRRLVQGLRQLGWMEGQNIRIDIRWSGGDAQTRTHLRGAIDRAQAGRDPDTFPHQSDSHPEALAPFRSCSCRSPIRLRKASLRA